MTVPIYLNLLTWLHISSSIVISHSGDIFLFDIAIVSTFFIFKKTFVFYTIYLMSNSCCIFLRFQLSILCHTHTSDCWYYKLQLLFPPCLWSLSFYFTLEWEENARVLAELAKFNNVIRSIFFNRKWQKITNNVQDPNCLDQAALSGQWDQSGWLS